MCPGSWLRYHHKARGSTESDRLDEEGGDSAVTQRATGPALDVAEIQSRAVAGTLWTAVASLVTLGSGLVANVVVSRALGPVGFGRLGLWSTVFALSSTAGGAGLGWATIQWGVASWARQSVDETAALLQKAAGWRLLAWLPVNLALGVVLLHRSGPLVVIAFLGAASIAAYLESALLALTVTQRTATIARIGVASSVASQVAGLVVAIVVPSAGGVWVARYAAGGLFPLLAVLTVDRRLRRAVLVPRLPRSMPAGLWGFSMRFVGSALLGLLVFNRSEVLVLGIYRDARALGIYALAYGLAAHLAAPVDAAAHPLVAGLGGLLAAEPESLGRGLLRAQRLVALASALLLAAVAPVLVLLVPLVYGGRFSGVGPLLAVLVVVSTLRALKHPVDVVLNARRQAGILLQANAISLALDAVVAFVAILFVGAWGAVAATATGQVVSMVLQVRGELRFGSVVVGDFVRACWVWAVAALCGAAALLAGVTLRAQVGDLGAAGLSAAIGALLVVLARAAVGPPLQAGDAAAVATGLPPRLGRPAAWVLAVFEPASRSRGRWRPRHRRRGRGLTGMGGAGRPDGRHPRSGR